jgi:hypothetical protein
MKQVMYYEVFDFNPSTCQKDTWRGTATFEAAAKAGLWADLSYPLYGDEAQSVDGWTFRAPR